MSLCWCLWGRVNPNLTIVAEAKDSKVSGHRVLILCGVKLFSSRASMLIGDRL